MHSIHPDIARVHATADSLDIILKNTHFSDSLLKDSSKTKLDINYDYPIPVAVIRFAEVFYDFIQPLRLPEKAASQATWLKQPSLTIKLILADSVITDQLSKVVFQLTEEESEQLRRQLSVQAELTSEQLDSVENEIQANSNSLLA